MTSVDTGPIHAGPFDAPAPLEPVVAADRGRHERASLAVLLGATGLLYLWGLGASGYANDFYSAAVQAGTQSWKAFFFGSFDSSNFITVDKPPAALWPMELSGRLFGFSSWSILAPQAIEGVLTVWLLYATVRRWSGHTAGLIAGGLLAITPVAVLMFRFNNPDALMTLLVVLAAYCTTRALENASFRWLGAAGLTMGFSFLAKGLQPFTVLPALAVAYLVAAPTTLSRRLLHLLGAGVSVIVGAGWWVLAVDLTPASARPYIGGSGDNSALGLAFGYNGLSRLSGGTGPGGGGNFSGATGLGRLFNDLNGGQIAWLLPTALVGVLGLLAITERRPRTDRTTAALIIWVGWVLVTGGVLSFAGGIIHTYYDVELAPAIAAIVAIAAVELWARRARTTARIGLAAGALVTGVWAYSLLHRTPTFHPWVAIVVVAAGIVAAVLVLVPPGRGRRGLAVVTSLVAAVAVAGGPAAFALDTASTPHTGSIPSAGPAAGTAAGFGGGPGRTGGFPGGRPPGAGERLGPPPGGTLPTGTRPTGRFPGGFAGGGDRTQSVNAALVALLKRSHTQWAAATTGSQSAGRLELASGAAVMSIGGFNGSDPAPTLAQFQRYVAAGDIHYFVAGGVRSGPGGVGGGTQISSWVAAHYTATSVGGATVYDLTTR